MKKILIPTDFSACADHAIDAGIQIAQKTGAQIFLFSGIAIPYDWSLYTKAQKEANPDFTKEIENTLLLFDAIKAKYPKIPIEVIYAGGKFIKHIPQLVLKHQIDLIVMGSHGDSGLHEYFIGSNTQRVIRTVKCPVLVVKHPIKEIQFKKIVFASSLNKNEISGLQKLKTLLWPFKPALHILHVDNGSIFELPKIYTREVMTNFKTHAEPLEVHTHLEENWNIENGVQQFADKIGADLIAISNHYRHPLKRLFTSSHVEALVNHSKLPVLSIDFPD